MGDRTKATGQRERRATRDSAVAGILRPELLARHVEFDRAPVGPAVAHWLETHWSLRWNLATAARFESQLIPHPTCSLTVELGSHPRPEMPPGETVVITGVVTKRFDVDLRGRGRVVGVRFSPGGLAALSRRPASHWTDRVVTARDVLPSPLCEALADPDLAACPRQWGEVAEAGLHQLVGDPDSRYDQLRVIVSDMLVDRSLLTVADVCARHDMEARTLQRLFTHYVGLGPKRVLARYRLHDVVAEIDNGYRGRLTDLAHKYGWYDQAHFARHFTAMVGVPPGQYRDRHHRQ